MYRELMLCCIQVIDANFQKSLEEASRPFDISGTSVLGLAHPLKLLLSWSGNFTRIPKNIIITFLYEHFNDPLHPIPIHINRNHVSLLC